MILKGNLIIADEGKYLNTPYGILQEVTLGEFQSIEDGEIVTKVYKFEDIQEVIPIRVQDEIYYVKCISNYNELVTELIRLKYSIDQELALIANARIGKTVDEEEFQNWRSLCKIAAKKYLNE